MPHPDEPTRTRAGEAVRRPVRERVGSGGFGSGAADPAATPLRSVPDGSELRVKVTPRASRAGIKGLVRDADGLAWLGVAVTTAPEAGKANAAVLELVAGALGVPRAACAIVAGHTARCKRIRVAADPAGLGIRLAELLAEK